VCCSEEEAVAQAYRGWASLTVGGRAERCGGGTSVDLACGLGRVRACREREVGAGAEHFFG
jgi:hypothetical protein